MNKLRLIIPLLMVAIWAMFSQSSMASNTGKGIAIVNGQWNRQTEKDYGVSLYRIIDGRLEPISSSNLQPDKSFALAIPIEGEGFYVLGSGHPMSQLSKYSVYLKPGDQLNIAINDSSYTLVGENTIENKCIEHWHNFVFPMEDKAVNWIIRRSLSTYVDYFPLVDQKAKEIKSLKFPKTKNPAFDKAFATYRKLDFIRLAVVYNFLPRTAHPETEDYIDFYKQLNSSELTSNTDLLRYPFGAQLITQIIATSQRANGKDLNSDFQKEIKNDTLIGEVALQQSGRIKSYKAFLDFINNEGKYILTADQKARLAAKKLELAQGSKEGQAAIDFRYPDIKGDTIALSDLKGKVVVIDVWATWCGPCKAQIPFLKKMEEEYRGKAVEFVSVSVDVEKDYQKWVDFVNNEGLKGIQLFANGWSEITKYYNIKGVPRFIVVDKLGNLVSIDAPRPSTPELKKMIDAELNK